MLCIATPNPDSPAETFIRQHIRNIAPENTVVIYFQGDGESLRAVPSLRRPHQLQTNWLIRLFRSVVNVIRHAYPGAISGPAAREVEDFLHEHKVQTVLAEFGPTGCALLPVCRKLGIRLVVNFHGYDATVMPRRRIIRHAYRNLNHSADAIVCASEHFSRVLVDLGFGREKINVIPYGIELEQFDLTMPKDPNLVLAVGRLVEKKAPHLTIRAFSVVLQKFPHARLEMIGDGPLVDTCRDTIRNLGLQGKVILHGAKPHEFVKQKFARASLFVQHSIIASNGDTESLGVSLLEAMASQVPVVATRHNGFVETVVDGMTGFLVEERDVNTMASRMIELLGDRHLQECMGKAGRQRVAERYEASKQAEALRRLLL